MKAIKFKIILTSGEPTSYYQTLSTIEDLERLQRSFGGVLLVNFKIDPKYKCPTIRIHDDYRYD